MNIYDLQTYDTAEYPYDYRVEKEKNKEKQLLLWTALLTVGLPLGAILRGQTSDEELFYRMYRLFMSFVSLMGFLSWLFGHRVEKLAAGDLKCCHDFYYFKYAHAIGKNNQNLFWMIRVKLLEGNYAAAKNALDMIDTNLLQKTVLERYELCRLLAAKGIRDEAVCQEYGARVTGKMFAKENLVLRQQILSLLDEGKLEDACHFFWAEGIRKIQKRNRRALMIGIFFAILIFV